MSPNNAEHDSDLVRSKWQKHIDRCSLAFEPDISTYPNTVFDSSTRLTREIIAHSGLFDSQFYLSTYLDVAAAQLDPLQHFIAYGNLEGRAPNRWFSPAYYNSQLASIDREGNALVHYIKVGEIAGLKPHPEFDPTLYRRELPAVDLAGVSPLWHFLTFNSEASRQKVPVRRYATQPRIEPRKPPLRQWSSTRKLGVNFVSPASRIAGLGVSARGFLEALQKSGTPVHPIEWTQGFEHHASCENKFVGVKELQPINIIHMNADIFHLVSNGLRQNGILSSDRYNIGIWYWELSSFRPEWMPWIACLDEIWCASQFNVDAVSAVSARPVKLMRPTLGAIKASGQYQRSHFGLAEDSLVFYYNCDLSSGIDRKNPEALIAAFRQEFGDDPRYQLVLKIGAPTYNPRATRLVMHAVGDASNIRLIDRTLTDAELADMLSICFAYVSPHRSEGLGLTIVEAMLSGCPVIATGYGGSADFVKANVARPLSYDFRELERTDEPYRRGCVWADPNISDIRKAMREMIVAPEAARAMALRGKAYVESLFSPESTGHAIKKRLQEIWRGGQPI